MLAAGSGGVAAYSAAAWTGFGTTVAETTATLAGLLFVAVSINLRRILEYPNLPGRAGQTLIMFATPLVVALFVLVPGQDRAALGWEFAVTGLIIVGAQLWIDARSGRSDQETQLSWVATRVFPVLACCGCVIAAGGSLLADGGGGLYWLVPAVLIAIISGLVNAWVLLVEILR
jgi:modulator of FtsH protease